MLGKAASFIFERGVSALADTAVGEKNRVTEVFRKIALYPWKILASFFVAPFLIVRIAITVENPIRRVFAVVGLLLSLLLSYIAATLLGSIVGAIFIASHIGIISGIGFLLGTTLSIYLSVIFSIVVFNAVSFFFLKISSEEVVKYLNEIST